MLAYETEPGLGNGGLGRLAACYLDSLATLGLPALGYGIRYEFGIFDQEIRDGWQVEVTDKWLAQGNPWEITRPEVGWYVNFSGRTERFTDGDGRARVRWVPGSRVKGIACDIPVPGYRVNNCNTLRLWRSEAVESFDFRDFNVGDYYGAVQRKDDLRDAVQGALSERRGGGGQAAASRATVLFRVVLAPGHAASARDEG